MRAALCALLLAGCAEHLTRTRPGWGSCRADGSAIICRGAEMALVECLAPRDDTCGALVLRYTDGERLFLYKPPGFDAARPQFSGGGAVDPEISSDGQLIWYRDGDVRGDEWHVFDTQSGVMQIRDAMGVSLLRENGSLPLWTKGAR
jgi:hypothetical protein